MGKVARVAVLSIQWKNKSKFNLFYIYYNLIYIQTHNIHLAYVINLQIT